MIASHSCIALLNLTEQAFFGCQQCAFTIRIDRAAFEHDSEFAEHGAKFLRSGCFRHEAANLFIIFIIGILRPSVEAPRDRCESFDVGAGVTARATSSSWAGGGTRPYVVNADYKHASRIARPNTICPPAMDSNVKIHTVSCR